MSLTTGIELVAAVAAGAVTARDFGWQKSILVAAAIGIVASLYLSQYELLTTEQRLALPCFAALIYSDMRYHRVSTAIVWALALLTLFTAPAHLAWLVTAIGVAALVKIVVPTAPPADLVAVVAAIGLFDLVGCVAVFAMFAVTTFVRLRAKRGSTLPRIAAMERRFFASALPAAGLIALALLVVNGLLALQAYPMNSPASVWLG